MGVQNSRRRSLVLGLVLLILVTLFTGLRYYKLTAMTISWPVFIIVPGLVLFMIMTALPRNATACLCVTAVFGATITMLGFILLYQSITRYFATWAYTWVLLFPTGTGLGFAISGLWTDSLGLLTTGIQWSAMGVVLFLVLGSFIDQYLPLPSSHSYINSLDPSFPSTSSLLFPFLLFLSSIYLIYLGIQIPKVNSPPRTTDFSLRMRT